MPSGQPMQTVQLSKCRHCGALQPEGAAVCASCGAKLTAATAAKPGSAKLRSVPGAGLDPQALLAKIDALDWDPTTTMDGPPPAPASPPPNWRLLLWPMLAGLAILTIGGAILLIGSDRGDPAPERIPAAAAAVSQPAPPPEPAPVAAEPPTPVADTDREAERARALLIAEDAAKRRAEKKRKAAAEQQAIQEEQDRRRRAEEERLRAEREAAEARARAAATPAAPARPASVKELCAKEDGFFARNNCEAKACAQPEWRASEYCQQRWQEQMRKLNSP